MAWPVREQVAGKTGGGWGPHRWVSILGKMNGGQSTDGKIDGGGDGGIIDTTEVQSKCEL
jgi:hypothetical protein